MNNQPQPVAPVILHASEDKQIQYKAKRLLEQFESVSQKPSVELVEYGDDLARLLWRKLRRSLSAEDQEIPMTLMRLALYADRLIPDASRKPMGASSQADLIDAIQSALKFLGVTENAGE